MFAGERTEAATPRRRQELHRRGQIPRSVELNSALVLFAALLALKFSLPSLANGIGELMQQTFTKFPKGDITAESTFHDGLRIVLATAKLAAPPMLAALAAGVLANVAQVGFLMTAQPLQPDLQRINPATGFKRLLSARSAVELLKSVIKATMVALIAWLTVRGQLGVLLASAQSSAGEGLRVLGSVANAVGFRVCVLLVVIAGLDTLYQRYHYERSIRMTRQEVREDLRQSEGDPHVRARQRQVMQQVLRRRMMQAVPTADVVIVNPTSLAVVLKYDPQTMRAPKVVAKGQRLIAERIRDVARQHGVPVVENKPLARSLFKTIEVDQEIPPVLYQAVAEILAFVYRLKRRSDGVME